MAHFNHKNYDVSLDNIPHYCEFTNGEMTFWYNVNGPWGKKEVVNHCIGLS